MSTQNLISVLDVTLASGAEVELAHGLFAASEPVLPFEVTCDRPSTIGVLWANELVVRFKNFGAAEATATFRVVREHSISTAPKALVAWRGWTGTVAPTGAVGGDLSGTLPDPLVVGLNNRPLDLTAPVANDYLRFDGTTWRHTLVAPGSNTAIYGSFTSNTTQDVATTPHVAQFDTVEGASGVSLVGGTKLTVAESGVYGVDISPQLAHSGGGTEIITFWLRVNGIDVPRSASSLEMGNNNNRTLPFLQIDLPLNAGQYVEWVFVSTSATDLRLTYFPAQLSPPAAFAIPAIPSIIANVKRIGSLP